MTVLEGQPLQLLCRLLSLSLSLPTLDMQQALTLSLSDPSHSCWFITSTMDAHQAALSFETFPAGDRLCAMASHSGATIPTRVSCERRRVAVGSSAIRGEVTPAQGDDDGPRYHFFRKPALGTWTTSFHKINQQLPLALDNPQAIINTLIAKSAMSKTEAWKMGETKSGNADDSTELESETMYCDILPRSFACQSLHLASRISEEVDSEFQLRKSQRLSTTSWDLLD